MPNEAGEQSSVPQRITSTFLEMLSHDEDVPASIINDLRILLKSDKAARAGDFVAVFEKPEGEQDDSA